VLSDLGPGPAWMCASVGDVRRQRVQHCDHIAPYTVWHIWERHTCKCTASRSLRTIYCVAHTRTSYMQVYSIAITSHHILCATYQNVILVSVQHHDHIAPCTIIWGLISAMFGHQLFLKFKTTEKNTYILHKLIWSFNMKNVPI